MSATPVKSVMPKFDYRWAVLRVSQFVMTLIVCCGLLSTGVFFVLAFFGIREGNLGLLGRAIGAGLVNICVVGLLGKVVRYVRRAAIDREIARHTEAVRLDPQDTHGHNLRAFAHVQRREYSRAIAHFDAAIRFDPTDAYAYVGRVNAYVALNLVDRVIAEATEAIRGGPTNALAYCTRATAYNNIGRFDLAGVDATEAIRLAPQLYLGYDARGYANWQRGSFNWMLKAFAIAWMVGTLAFLRRDHFNWRTPRGTRVDLLQAVADFTEAIRLNPSAYDCYAGRARAYWALGENGLASSDQAKMASVPALAK